jgi:hypothetical protein
MKLRIARKILKHELMDEKSHKCYQDVTVMRAIKRINPSVWNDADRTFCTVTAALLLGWSDGRIRHAIDSEWLKQRELEIERIWANMTTSSGYPTTTWD